MSSFALSALINIKAAAPSLIPDAFPAVTVPFSLNIGFNLFNASIVFPNLGNSSVSKTTSPFLVFIVIGTISSLNSPDLIAFSAFNCDSSENLSCSSLDTAHCSATFSAVIPI
ncbi:hypothetical protein D3C76_1021270 [compost metagenome]